MELEMDFTLIQVTKILDQIDDPFGRWQTSSSIHPDMVLTSLSDGSWSLADEPYGNGGALVRRNCLWHARRIAWLMKNGWDAPIDIDVGIPSMGFYPYILVDGHHRLCAAIMTGETVIKAQVSGALDYAFQLFGVDCALDHTPEKVDV
jgi:hypothetical protein